MIRVESLATLHDREYAEQELVHASAQRGHFRKRSLAALRETIVVSSNSRIVLQTGERRHVDQLPQPASTSTSHSL